MANWPKGDWRKVAASGGRLGWRRRGERYGNRQRHGPGGGVKGDGILLAASPTPRITSELADPICRCHGQLSLVQKAVKGWVGMVKGARGKGTGGWSGPPISLSYGNLSSRTPLPNSSFPPSVESGFPLISAISAPTPSHTYFVGKYESRNTWKSPITIHSTAILAQHLYSGKIDKFTQSVQFQH